MIPLLLAGAVAFVAWGILFAGVWLYMKYGKYDEFVIACRKNDATQVCNVV